MRERALAKQVALEFRFDYLFGVFIQFIQRGLEMAVRAGHLICATRLSIVFDQVVSVRSHWSSMQREVKYVGTSYVSHQMH